MPYFKDSIEINYVITQLFNTPLPTPDPFIGVGAFVQNLRKEIGR